MFVSIVTLNYKKANLTITCMESLYKEFKPEFENNIFELIIVDNASGDDSVRKLESIIKKNKYQNIKIIENSENAGFSKGCNLGAKFSKGDFILFLNNDTVIKDKGILKMAEYMQDHNEVSILGGQLKNMDDTLQASTGDFYNLDKVLLLLLGFQKYGILDKSPENISKVDWVKGGLLMIRKNVFEKLKGFDEKIFMYTEDMELCYRAKLNGFNTYFYPNINILHQDHGSTNRTFAIVHIYENLLYFYKKHKSFIEYLIAKFLMSSKAVLLIILGTITNNNYLKNTYKEALEVINK